MRTTPTHSATRQRQVGICPYGHTSDWRQRPGDGRAALILQGGVPTPILMPQRTSPAVRGAPQPPRCREHGRTPPRHSSLLPIFLSLGRWRTRIYGPRAAHADAPCAEIVGDYMGAWASDQTNQLGSRAVGAEQYVHQPPRPSMIEAGRWRRTCRQTGPTGQCVALVARVVRMGGRRVCDWQVGPDSSDPSRTTRIRKTKTAPRDGVQWAGCRIRGPVKSLFFFFFIFIFCFVHYFEFKFEFEYEFHL